MKKILISVLVLVLVVAGCLTIFSACSKSDYEHTIVFYSSQGTDIAAKTANAITAFEKKYPGWKVEHVRCGDYPDVLDQVMTDFNGGTYPDLAYCYADHVAMYLPTGKVVDLNNYFKSTETVKYIDPATEQEKEARVGYDDKEVADFLPGYLNEGYAEHYSGVPSNYDANALLTLPFIKSTELMFYNKTALDALGASVPETWDDIWALKGDLKRKYPNATLLGYDSEANWFITMCMQNGWDYTSIEEGNHYLFENEDTIGWLEDLKDLYDEGLITTRKDYNGAYTSTLFTLGVENGGLLFCIGSSAGASHQDPGSAFEYGIAPIPGSYVLDNQGNKIVDADDPTGYKVNRACISQGPSLVMLSGGNRVSNVKEKELMTWLFMKELLDPELQGSVLEITGYNPSRESVYETEAYKAFKNNAKNAAQVKAAEIALTLKDRFYTSPAFEGSSEARNQVGNALFAALRGISSPAKALSDGVKNCGGNKK